jgi:hypothetical protein
MSKPKLSIGIAAYGPQESLFWQPLGDMIGHLHKYVEYVDLLVMGVSATDINRNKIVDTFMNTDSEYLWWIDADNPPAADAVERLLGVGKPLVSGLYYGGSQGSSKHNPIAYIKREDNTYYSLDSVYQWEVGEIVPVDAVGMGCFLTHRSVYEDMRVNYVQVQAGNGWQFTLHKDKVRNLTEYDAAKKGHPYSGQVKDNTFFLPVSLPTISELDFPYFQSQFTRTEDLPFCENAKELGYEILVDTSIEVGHVKPSMITGEDFRKKAGRWVSSEVEDFDVV